ncbi:hypothetical protein CXF68_19695 [Tenacibaculum sp. Bg11-29]|uniref:hypothetical protein n=1 Tax=Tenacibaculum sp. Bg11-29 TaxID=2058306 RepID=UPI000C3367CA|nr:hypothetical protein [Tenacibaculum sp. Bg11-29]PKH52782.1 hypothetical protein CXF68_19695 [Tenacibaculum sp. Bg11-29]
MANKHVFILILSVFLYSSCVKDLDFKQAENIELTPTMVAALVNIDIKQTSIVNAIGVENTEFVDVSRFDIFSNSVFEKVERMVVHFDITNPFNRNFTLLLTFYDDNSTVTYQFPLITIPDDIVNYKFSHEIIIANSPLILNSKELNSTIQLLPSLDGTIINVNDNKTFKINSSGVFYFKIN